MNNVQVMFVNRHEKSSPSIQYFQTSITDLSIANDVSKLYQQFVIATDNQDLYPPHLSTVNHTVHGTVLSLWDEHVDVHITILPKFNNV